VGNAEDKRIFQRFEVHCQGTIQKDNEAIDIKIMNMSGKGLGFRTSVYLCDHERITVKLLIKDHPEPLNVSGEVIWTEVIDEDTYDVGFQLDMTSWIKMSQILGEYTSGDAS